MWERVSQEGGIHLGRRRGGEAASVTGVEGTMGARGAAQKGSRAFGRSGP